MKARCTGGLTIAITIPLFSFWMMVLIQLHSRLTTAAKLTAFGAVRHSRLRPSALGIRTAITQFNITVIVSAARMPHANLEGTCL